MRIPRPPPGDEEVGKAMAEATTPQKMKELGVDLNKINSEYFHWDEIQLRYRPEQAMLLWGYTNLFRQTNARYLSINGLTLRYVQTPRIEKMLHNTDMTIGSKADHFLEEGFYPVELRKKYLISSLMEESISSSQLEGAVTTRAVAKKMLRENRKPRDRSEQMIYNNYFTMKYIKEIAKSKTQLTLELMKEIQRRITKDTLDDKEYVGAFRKDNEIAVYSKDAGQLLHTPPDYKDIEKLLQKVCDFINSEPTDYYLHPIAKAIILHYMIGYIHPFYDGNGRTARTLFYWYAISQGYTYIEYIAISSAIKNAPIQYTNAYLFSESDHNDVTYFVKFNLDKIRIAIEIFNKYVERKVAENEKIIRTIRYNDELNYRQADVLIDLCKREKQMTFEEMQERYDTTYQTARTDLLHLVELGYLNKRLIGKQFLFTPDREKCMSAINQS